MATTTTTQNYALAKTESGATIPIPVPENLSNDPVTKAVYDNIMGKLPKKAKPITVYCKACSLEFSSQVVLDTHLAGSKHQRKLKSKELMKNLEETESGFERNTVSGVIRCTICDITVNSPQLLATHVAGNKHKSRKGKRENGEEGGTPAKKLCPAGATKQSNGTGVNRPSSGANKTTPITNDVKKPQKKERAPLAISIPSCVTKLEDTKTGGKFLCNPCQAHCNSDIQLTQHLASKKHVEKVSGKKKIPPTSVRGTGRGWKTTGSSYGRGRGANATRLGSSSSTKWDSSALHSTPTETSLSAYGQYGQALPDTSLSSGYTDSYGLSSLGRATATDYSYARPAPPSTRGSSRGNGTSFARSEVYARADSSYPRTSAYPRTETYPRSDYGTEFAAARTEDLSYSRATTEYATQSYGAEYGHGYAATPSVSHAPARGMPFTYTQPLSHNFVAGGSIL